MKKILLTLFILASVAITFKVSMKDHKNDQLLFDNLHALTQIETNRYDCYAIHRDADDDELAIWMFICSGCDYRWVTYASVVGFCVK